MEPAETNPEKTVGSGAFDPIPADGKPSSSTTAENDAGGPSAKDVDPDENDIAEISDAIQALELKVLELKKQVKAGQTNRSRPNILSELEKNRRIEATFYKHRKDWERKRGPGTWYLSDDDVREYWSPLGWGDETSWRIPWTLIQRACPAPAPDPFDSPQDYPVSQGGSDADDDGEFDRIIDYGDRRDRLRKNFEWEIDRLYMEEEMERRKRQRQEERLHPGDTEEEQRSQKGDDPKDQLSTSPNLFDFVKPKSQRLDWSSFKPVPRTEESQACVLDILVGEPMIDIDGSRRWYGSSRRRVRKLDPPQDRKALPSMVAGQPPLPERIRIHSKALLQIFGSILGKNMTEWTASTFILIRPFKLLVQYEPALRNWCTALENKLQRATTAEDDFPSKVSDGLDTSAPDASADSCGLDPESTYGPSDHEARSKGPMAPTLAVESGYLSSTQKDVDISVDRNDGGEREKEAGERKDEGRKDEENDDEENEEEDDPNDLSKSSTALAHLKCLLDFVNSDISVKRQYLSSHQCHKVLFTDLWLLFRPGSEVISHDGKQAYRVVGVTSAKHGVGVASRWEWFGSSQNKRKKQVPFSISCVYIDFDGENIGPVSKVFDFKRFDGERDVTSLEVYPLRFHPAKRSDFSDVEWKEADALPNDQKYRRKLIRRGVKFLDVAAVKHMYYTGPTLEVKEEVESQVVVDFEAAFAAEDPSQQLWKPTLTAVMGNPPPENVDDNADEDALPDDGLCRLGCCHRESVYDDSDVDQEQRVEYINSLLPSNNSLHDQPSIAIIPRLLTELQSSAGQPPVSDDELVIMSYRVFGFVLRSRKWAKLDLSYLTEANMPEDSNVADVDTEADEITDKKEPATAFDRLVLENWHRNMIVSLVSQHFRDKESKTGRSEEFDIVKGKGKGLIILLHGAPGVGKTSTAEGVAELFKKPLFQITCGDLGTTAAEVEKALETNFALASMWDCILLLDEADVFLAERTKEDFQRNGLVAVFLRVMEYYTGILFLTTNRVGDFDEAFTSRIHISLYYPQLSHKKTVDVFTINMDMIEERCRERGRKIEIGRVKIGSFAAKHFEDFPKARWNGRQIRNACQTALALAEFEAQGNSHKVVHNPDVVVKLSDNHFEVVRDAYVEFTKYMNDVYGANASRRAKDNYIRAIWVDESEAAKGSRAAGMENKTAGFMRLVQGQPSASHQQPSPQQMPQQPLAPQQQPQYNPYMYQNFAPSQPAYPVPGQVPVQAVQYTTGQPWINPTTLTPNTSFQGPGGGQAEMPGLQQQPMTPPQRQYQQQYQQQPVSQQQSPQQPQQQPQQPLQPVNPGFNQRIQAMYEAPSQPGPN